jgi:hypothetical protein
MHASCRATRPVNITERVTSDVGSKQRGSIQRAPALALGGARLVNLENLLAGGPAFLPAALGGPVRLPALAPLGAPVRAPPRVPRADEAAPVRRPGGPAP